MQALSRRDDESYEAFVARLGGDPLARVVKLADLADNSDLSRIALPGPDDLARLTDLNRRYRERFGFPYVAAMRLHGSLADVFRSFEQRLHNDPATGVMRHADAGYQIAIDCAKEQGLNLPMITGK